MKKKKGKKLDYKNEKKGKCKRRVAGIGPWIRQKFIKARICFLPITFNVLLYSES